MYYTFTVHLGLETQPWSSGVSSYFLQTNLPVQLNPLPSKPFMHIQL